MTRLKEQDRVCKCVHNMGDRVSLRARPFGKCVHSIIGGSCDTSKRRVCKCVLHMPVVYLYKAAGCAVQASEGLSSIYHIMMIRVVYLPGPDRQGVHCVSIYGSVPLAESISIQPRRPLG